MKWPLSTLGAVAEVNPRSREWATLSRDTEVSFVPMATVSEVTASIAKQEVRPLGDVQKGYVPFRNGDVIFAKITPCFENGKAALARGLANGVGFGSTEFHVLRARKPVLPEFLYYFVRQQSFRNDGARRMQGAAGQQRVPEDFVSGYSIAVPSRTEQRWIVDILDQADALRKKRVEADAKTARILPALFHEMFCDPGHWDSRETESLGRLVSIQGGGTPSKQNLAYWDGPIPWVSAKDMKRDFIPDAEDHISELALEESACGLVKTDCILVVVRGMILARYVPLAINTRPVAINQDMKALEVTDKRVSPLYLLAAMKAQHPRLHAEVGIAAHGTRKLDTDRLLALPILIPEQKKHDRFVQWFVKCRRTTDLISETGPRLNRLFDVLLHRAFCGDLTAKWREAHMKELMAEMEAQAKLLEARA